MRLRLKPLKLARYTPVVLQPTEQGWVKRQWLAPGTVIEMAGVRYVVARGGYLRRLTTTKEHKAWRRKQRSRS